MAKALLELSDTKSLSLKRMKTPRAADRRPLKTPSSGYRGHPPDEGGDEGRGVRVARGIPGNSTVEPSSVLSEIKEEERGDGWMDGSWMDDGACPSPASMDAWAIIF